MKHPVNPGATGSWLGSAGFVALLLMAAAGLVLTWLAMSALPDTAASDSAPEGGPAPGRLVLVFLDVNEGDAAYIRTPTGRSYLIDGGPGGSEYNRFDAGEQRILPFLQRRGIQRLDGVLATHAHSDHVGGLLTVLGRTELAVERVFDPGFPYTSRTYERFLELVMQRKIPFRRVKEGDLLDWDPHLTVQVMNPGPRFLTGTRSDANSNSMALRIAYGSFSALLAADIEEPTEQNLRAYGQGLRSTILKVPHHGGGFSSTPAFVQAVSPEVAVISVGARNRFSHPSPKVVDRYLEQGARVFRTDHHGSVTVISDGVTYAVRTERNR